MANKNGAMLRGAVVCVAMLLPIGGALAQSLDPGSGSSGNVNIGNKSAPISSDVKSGPGNTTLGTAKSIGAQGDATLSKPAPYKDDPALLKSNKDIERALKSICRGC